MSATLHHARITAPWVDDVINGRTYAGSGTKAAVAAEYSKVQLENPAASGRWIYVLSIRFGAGAATTVKVATRIARAGSKVQDIPNLAADGADGVGDIYTSSNVAAQVTDPEVLYHVGVSAAGTDHPLDFDDTPIVLKPGDVLTVEDTAVNQALTVNFRTVERPT